MKYSRYLLLFSLLAASPAFAASVVMVQFGSFETSDEANKRLSDIKSTNAAVLGNLPTTVREVKLPPDNLTVYRTQAGPLPDRSAASALCGKLAANGSECYVVETAVSQSAPATKTADTAAPASAPVAKSLSSSTATGSTVSTASAPATPAVNSVRIPEISRAAALPSSAPVVTASNGSSSSPQLQNAMDNAVAAQNSGTIAGNTTVIETPAPKKSFWSHLNPFSSDKPAAKPVAVAKVPEPIAAPVEPVTSSNLSASSVALAPLSPAARAPETSSLTASSAIVLPSSATPAASSSARPLLLPPPAPLTAQDKQALETPVVKPEPEILAGPIGGTPTSVIKSTPIVSAPIAATDGNVQVEEAKRVPVTETVTAPATVAAAPVIPPVSLLPSSTLGQKTLWAQIGQFNDSEEALTFWENYRQTHPDFPVVRVRVSSSLQQQEHGNDRVWLRVGPFARDGFINSLCSSLANNENEKIQSKRCSVVTDLGIAARPGSAPAGYLQGSRYKR